MKNILTNIVIISLLLSVLLSNSQAKVMVNAAFGGYPVAVCQPNDTGSGCTGTGGSSSGGGSGNVGIGTTGWDAYYATSGSTVTATKAIFINSNSNVGIGTTIPQGGLSVMNGNVGIGTWVPSKMLEVGSPAVGGNGAGIRIDGKNGTSFSYTLDTSLGAYLDLSNNNGSSSHFTMDSAGNIGIGVSGASSFPLDVVSTASTGINVQSNSTTATQFIVNNTTAKSFSFASTGSANSSPGYFQIFDSTDSNVPFEIKGSATTPFIDLLGNVGIGTTNPLGALAIMNGNVGIGTWIPGDSFIVKTGNVGIGTNTPNVLLGVGSTNQFNVDSNGNVGIGTMATNNTILSINSTVSSITGLLINAPNLSGGNAMNIMLPISTDLSSGKVFTWQIPGESFGRGVFYSDGALGFGPGSATRDIFIRRSGTNTLMIDKDKSSGSPGNLIITGAETIGSTATAPSNGLIVAGNVGIGSATPGQLLDVFGTVRMPKLGTTLSVASGSNGCQGQAILSSGTVTVSTTCTPATSQGIFLQDATTGSLVNIGVPTVGTVTSATSFVINSSNTLDSSNVNWWIMKSS